MNYSSRVLVNVCLIVSFCALAFAQTQPHKGSADIPFEFYVGSEKLPAGRYSIELVSPSYAMLRSQDGKKELALYFVQVGEPPKEPEMKLVFATRDQKHLLAEAWGWFGKAQYTGFDTKAGDQMQSVLIKPSQKAGN